MILSLSTFIFTMERAAVVFAVMVTQSFPVGANGGYCGHLGVCDYSTAQGVA